MPQPKCKQCKIEVPNKLVYIEQDVNKKDGTIDKKKVYFCCVECRDEFEKPKEVVESPYTKLNNYIQQLYLQQGYNKNQIPWKLLTAQIKKIMEDDKSLTYAQLQYVLNYMVSILELNLFNEEFNGSILNLLPYYIQEAKEFCLKCKDIRESVKDYDFSDEVRIVRVSVNRDRKVEEMDF